MVAIIDLQVWYINQARSQVWKWGGAKFEKVDHQQTTYFSENDSGAQPPEKMEPLICPSSL